MNRFGWVSFVGIAIIAALAAVPLVGSSYSMFVMAQVIALLYIAVAVELSNTFGRILSFCSGSFFAIGAFAAYHAFNLGSTELLLVLALAVLAAMVAGLCVGSMVVRMKGAHTAVIGTMAIATILHQAASALTQFTGGEDGLTVRHAMTVLGHSSLMGVNATTYFVALIPVSALLLLYQFLRPTPFGIVMRAVGENDIRTEQLGFDVNLRRLAIFTVAAGVAGFGGAMYCVLVGHVSSALFDPFLSLNGVLWATVGGLGSPFGGLIGTVIINPVTELASGSFRYVEGLIGALLIVTALVFPKGVAGAIDRLRRQPQRNSNVH
jgi:branched-chain amino acid transport system permease protein